MSKKPSDSSPRQAAVTAERFLRARPFRNEAMEFEFRPDGTALAKVPLRRPRWLVPPLSWIMPFSSQRRIELDTLGAAVLGMCDGKKTVENIIEAFAEKERLSFREAQLPVTQFLRQVAERGLIAIVGLEKDADS